MNNPYHTSSTPARLDSPFGRHRTGPFFSFCDETVRWIPLLDRGLRFHSQAKGARRASADTLLTRTRYKPSRYARTRCNGSPDLFGCSRDLHFGFDRSITRRIFLHGHGEFSTFLSLGSGCAKTN